MLAVFYDVGIKKKDGIVTTYPVARTSVIKKKAGNHDCIILWLVNLNSCTVLFHFNASVLSEIT